MKFWIKILIALAVIVVVVFGVWAFFFREQDDLSGYNRTAALIEYKNSLNLEDKLNNLTKLDYVGKDEKDKITDDTEFKKEILKIRNIMLKTSLIEGKDDQGIIVYTHDSYVTIDKYIDEIIYYYLPYMKADYVESGYAKKVEDCIAIYQDSLKVLAGKIDALCVSQQNIVLNVDDDSANVTQFEILKNNYIDVRARYRTCLSNAGELLKSIINYVDLGIYKSSLYNDSMSSLYNCFVRSLTPMANAPLVEETDYASDLHFVVDKIEKIKDNKESDVYTVDYNEHSFVTSMNTLIHNYTNVLDKVLSSTNLIKRQMADNDISALSTISEKARDSVITMLNVLGY